MAELGAVSSLRLPNARVELRGPVPSAVVEALSDLTDQRLHLDPSAVHVELRVSEHDDGWQIEPSGDTGPGIGPSATTRTDADLLDALVGRLNRLAFHTDPQRLHLHAASLEVDGVGVLLAGASGSGKSTVAVELLQRGAGYLTDECLTVSPGSSTVFAYPKPITLKQGSIEWFSADPSHPAAQLASARNGRTHLRAGKLGTVTPYATVGAIVLLRYSHQEPPSFRPLTPAEACVRLLSDSLDGIRLGPSSLDTVAQLAAGATAWELVHDGAAEAAALIADLRPPLRRSLVVSHRLHAAMLHRSDGERSRPTADAHSSGDPSVRLLRLDDHGALYDGTTRALVVVGCEQVDDLERGVVDVDSMAELVSALGSPPQAEVVPEAQWPLGLGLPGRTAARLGDDPPITAAQLDAAIQGRCTGVIVEALVRGRVTQSATLERRARQAHRAGQATCLLLERELPTLVDVLNAGGVDPIVLKGPVSANDGPLPPHLRDFGDLDLLVPPAQVDAAVAALLADGFERCFEQVAPDFDRRFAKSITLRRRFSGDWGERAAPTFEVDLHRTLTPGPYGAVVPLDELHDRAVPVCVNGRWYRALHPEHRFLHACLHTVLGSPEPRLHSVRDLVTSAPRTPAGAEAALDIARRWGVVGVVQRAFDVAESTFPSALPPELVSGAADLRPAAVERLYLASYHRPGRTYSLPAMATVLALPGWTDRRDFVATHLRRRRSARA